MALAVAALVIAATVWWCTARAPMEATRGAAPPHAVATAPSTSTAPSTPGPQARIAPLPPAPVAPYPAHGAQGISTDDPLTAYRRANVYPPTSRPLTSEQLDLLQPFRRHEAMRPTDKSDGVSFLFTADRYFVIGDETITATLVVQRDGVPIPAKVTKSYAVALDPVTHREPPIDMVYAASGAQLASTFAPAKLGLARQTAIAMYIEFDYGTGRQLGHFDFQYTPTSGIPARFNGQFADSIEAGSLVIRAGLDVTAAGNYIVDCNLYDAANQPVAWSRFKGELAAGSQRATLVFFGKVLVDGKAKGPFHIGQLRGARYAPALDPDLETIPPFAGAFATQPYQTEQFSDAEYDSEDKRRMIDLLGADNQHRGGAGSNGQPSGSDD